MTFRLVDSLPKEALLRLQNAAQAESLRDDMLDQGWGACWLRSNAVAKLVEDAFLTFDDTRYRLHAWTIMPNHIHVLASILPDFPLGTIVSSWKRYTARKANGFLGRAGPFWQDDYWDRFIRSEEHFAATVQYIDLNPVKAGLVAKAEEWPWSSARLRR